MASLNNQFIEPYPIELVEETNIQFPMDNETILSVPFQRRILEEKYLPIPSLFCTFVLNMQDS